MKILMWACYILFLMSLAACSSAGIYPTEAERNSHFYADENGFFRNDFGIDVQKVINAEPVDDVVEVHIVTETPKRKSK